MTLIETETVRTGEYPQIVRVRTHTLNADVGPASGRAAVYRRSVRVTFHGPISDEQRASLYLAVAACPVHKLMTTTDVQTETVMP
jgi:putative redox protein